MNVHFLRRPLLLVLTITSCLGSFSFSFSGQENEATRTAVWPVRRQMNPLNQTDERWGSPTPPSYAEIVPCPPFSSQELDFLKYQVPLITAIAPYDPGITAQPHGTATLCYHADGTLVTTSQFMQLIPGTTEAEKITISATHQDNGETRVRYSPPAPTSTQIYDSQIGVDPLTVTALLKSNGPSLRIKRGSGEALLVERDIFGFYPPERFHRGAIALHPKETVWAYSGKQVHKRSGQKRGRSVIVNNFTQPASQEEQYSLPTTCCCKEAGWDFDELALGGNWIAAEIHGEVLVIDRTSRKVLSLSKPDAPFDTPATDDVANEEQHKAYQEKKLRTVLAFRPHQDPPQLLVQNKKGILQLFGLPGGDQLLEVRDTIPGEVGFSATGWYLMFLRQMEESKLLERFYIPRNTIRQFGVKKNTVSIQLHPQTDTLAIISQTMLSVFFGLKHVRQLFRAEGTDFSSIAWNPAQQELSAVDNGTTLRFNFEQSPVLKYARRISGSSAHNEERAFLRAIMAAQKAGSTFPIEEGSKSLSETIFRRLPPNIQAILVERKFVQYMPPPPAYMRAIKAIRAQFLSRARNNEEVIPSDEWSLPDSSSQPADDDFDLTETRRIPNTRIRPEQSNDQGDGRGLATLFAWFKRQTRTSRNH